MRHARDEIRRFAAALSGELIALRRDIHQHPEVAHMEHRTTRLIAERLTEAGLQVRYFDGTGLMCDIGAGGSGRVGLRADIDALPLPETSGLPFASLDPVAAHACGHDIHTAAGVGAALILARLEREGLLHTGVRLIFQPAEEVQPGGAQWVMRQGALDGVTQIFALHCDPKVDVGHLGSRSGPITASSDAVRVTVRSRGGHTSRPHLTGDVVHALGCVIAQAGTVLDRRIDARAGANLTWGMVQAGYAPNAIPTEGFVHGTLRCLDAATWDIAGELVVGAIHQLLAPYDVDVEVDRQRGLPPVVNTPAQVVALESAARAVLGGDGVQETAQSLGGEDFAWFLTQVPGAMARLGTRTPGGESYDLHRGDIVFDERAIAIGAQVLAMTAITATEAAAG